eukprot:TRINITY_DN64717_c0_g1_i1.p1 TRINITY_DN64717_c0_g1~~TRINITY_DN64717_c0_g1_i1.p1  ORF type:complete len:505 (-),score=89.44 TRINITY_DN64717_c0_g1_i1:8-1522(-)
MAAPKAPLPDWCKAPDASCVSQVSIIFGGIGKLDLPPSRKAWRLGRKDKDSTVKPHLELRGSLVSRDHAYILRDVSGAVFLRDNGSTQGTWLGAERLEPFKVYKWTSGTVATFGVKPHHDSAKLEMEQLQIPKAKHEKRPRDEAVEKDAAKEAPERKQEEALPSPPVWQTVSTPSRAASEEKKAELAKATEKTCEAARKQTVADEDVQRAPKQRRLSVTTAPPVSRQSIAPDPEPKRAGPIGPELPPDFVHRQQRSEAQQVSRAESVQRAQEIARQQRQSTAGQAGRRASTAAPLPASSSASNAAAPNGKPKKCDKCDGPHLTDHCPHFKKTREDHKDAWCNYGKKGPVGMGKSGGKLVIRSARPVRQPGDGSCLFHSLCFGLSGGRKSGGGEATQLRRDLANFIAKNPRLEISGDTLEEWVRWDARSSVHEYTRRMAVGGWGGGIEMAACALLKKVNVHVYETLRGGRGYERISCFEPPQGPARQTIHVLYQGGVHYDALVLN